MLALAGNQTQLTLADDVACHSVSKGKVSGDGDQQIDEARRANAGHDYGCSLKVGIIADFVENGKHLHSRLDDPLKTMMK